MTQPKRDAINWAVILTAAIFMLGLSLRAGTIEEKVLEQERAKKELADEVHQLREILYEVRGDVKSLLKEKPSKTP